MKFEDKNKKHEKRNIENIKPEARSSTSKESQYFNFRYFILMIIGTAICSIAFEQLLESSYIKYPFNYIQNCSKCYKTVQKYGDLVNINIGSPKFTILDDNENNTRHAVNVLRRIGLEKVGLEDGWDFLWSQTNPFKKLSKLKKHQIVNHFPGISSISIEKLRKSKVPYLSKSFLLPDDNEKFESFKKKNPKSLLIVNTDNEIIIETLNEIDLSTKNKVFLKEYIDDPFLIDDYKFEIRVYAIITSINPLRIYIYNSDADLRFCPEKYSPFNASNSNKFSTKNNYTPLWEVPSLKVLYNDLKFSFKESFNAYLRSLEKDPAHIWEQIEEIIRDVILKKEKNILKESMAYNIRNFFQLLRFDFLLRKNLKVNLQNVDLEPNLSSPYNESSVYFEQMLYNVMRLTDIARPAKRNSFKRQNRPVQTMITAEKNVAVDGPSCLKHNCYANCKIEECRLCLNCLKQSDLEILFKSWREHIHRGDTKRIFPKPIVNLKEYNIQKETQNLSTANQMMTKWFYEKCKMLSIWCI